MKLMPPRQPGRERGQGIPRKGSVEMERSHVVTGHYLEPLVALNETFQGLGSSERQRPTSVLMCAQGVRSGAAIKSRKEQNGRK